VTNTANAAPHSAGHLAPLLSHPNIFLSTVSPNTLTLCSPINMTPHCHSHIHA